MKRIKCLSAFLTLTLLFCIGNVDAQQKQSIKESKTEFRLDEGVKTGITPANKKATALQDKKVVNSQTIKATTKAGAKKSSTATAPKKNSEESGLESKKVVSPQTIKADSKQTTGKVAKATSNQKGTSITDAKKVAQSNLNSMKPKSTTAKVKSTNTNTSPNVLPSATSITPASAINAPKRGVIVKSKDGKTIAVGTQKVMAVKARKKN